MRCLRVGALAVLLAVVVLAPGWAPARARDAAEPAGVRVSDVDVSGDNRVSLVVAVPGLLAGEVDAGQAFQIREDGQLREVEVTPVATDLEVALVVDTSAGQAPRDLRGLHNIVMELILRLPGDAPVALVATGHPSVVVQAATTDALERAAAAGRLDPRGDRATYDALALAADALPGRPGARRAVVLVGHGDDEASSTTADEVRGRLDAASAALYVVAPGADEAGPLAGLAAASGGLLVPVASDRDPLEAAATVLEDLLGQYRLTFEARGSGDTAVDVRVAEGAVRGQATVSVPLPAVPEPTTVAPDWAWLAAAAAAVSAALVFGGAALAGARRPVRPQSASAGTGVAVWLPVWPDVAAQVHREVGGDLQALHVAAERIVVARRQTAAALRAVAFEGRLAVAFLTPLPVVVGALRYVLDPAYLARLADSRLGLAGLVGAATLTAAGGLWLHRVAQPPFTALPAAWRAYDERIADERKIADALDRASLYATAGLDLHGAIERVLPGELAGASRPPSGDLPAPDALAAARARLHESWVHEAEQRAERVAASALLPFVVCIVPATAVAGLAGGS